MKARPMFAGLALAAIVAMSGCAGVIPEKVQGPSAQLPSVESAPEETTDDPTNGQFSTDDDGSVYEFGSTVVYESGLTVTIGQPVKFTRDEYASGGENFKQWRKFKVTVDNNADATFDPTLFSVTASTGEDEADQVFDVAHGLNGSPDTVLLPFRKKSWYIGFGINPKQDFVMEVSPDYESDSAIFAGSIS